MIKILTTFCMAFIVLTSCNSNKTDENKSPITGDSHASKNNLPVDHVKGKSGNLYVDDGGEGNIPVLFVHSFGGSTEHWKNQLTHLRKDRRAIAFDLSGHGKSDTTVTDYEIETFADDIAAVADSLKLERFILVGHSLGGAASVKYAGDHPERLAGLMLVGTPGKSSAEQAKPIIASLHSDKYDQVMSDYMKQLLTNAKPEVNTLVTQDFKSISKPVAIEIIESIFLFDPTPSLANYTGPAMIVSAPRESKDPGSLHKIKPNLPYKEVDGTSHWIQLDKPDEFNAILDDFIKGIK